MIVCCLQKTTNTQTQGRNKETHQRKQTTTPHTEKTKSKQTCLRCYCCCLLLFVVVCCCLTNTHTQNKTIEDSVTFTHTKNKPARTKAHKRSYEQHHCVCCSLNKEDQRTKTKQQIHPHVCHLPLSPPRVCHLPDALFPHCTCFPVALPFQSNPPFLLVTWLPFARHISSAPPQVHVFVHYAPPTLNRSHVPLQ